MGSTRRPCGTPLWCGAALLLMAARVSDTPAPDSWGPFTDQRVVSPGGRHYAVLRSRDGVWPGRFELVRRRAGEPPIEPAVAEFRIVEADGGGVRREKVEVARDQEDELLVAGTLPQLPMDAAVSDEPLGIVLFDKYANVGYGQTLAFLDEEGQLAWSRSLEDLFGGEPKGTSHSVSSRWWSAAWGVDAELGVAWVLSHGGEFRAVSLGTGEVSTPDSSGIASLCARGEDHERVAAMDAVLGREDLDLAPFSPVLAPIAVDDAQPLATRLRAAVLCHRAGVRVDHGGWFRVATRADDLESAIFAALHLPEIVGDEDTLSPLVAVLVRLEQPLEPREMPGAFFGPARLPGFVAAFGREGEPGLTRLRQLVEAEGTSATALVSASVIWWRLGQTSLPDRLRGLICTGAESDANTALNALIYSEPEGLAGILLDLARAGTVDDVRLAMYFEDHPHADAVAPLERMLGEARDDGWEVRVIRRALAACRR